jgi:hypothetical protein
LPSSTSILAKGSLAVPSFSANAPTLSEGL